MQKSMLVLDNLRKYLFEGLPVSARKNDVEDRQVHLLESEIPSCTWDIPLYPQNSGP